MKTLNQTYLHTETIHNFVAPREIVPIIISLMNINSVLDVGCGLGTWLKVFEEHNVIDYIGVDGDYVDRKLLKISTLKFFPHDLNKYWNLNRKFDLVVSLEVAEHLKRDDAINFIKNLINHGDVIVFSAAIPGQGGQNHYNEQWLSYWVQIFEEHNYFLFDALRYLFWNNPLVEVWYKQNMVVFCRQGHPLEQTLKLHSSPYIDIVHPELFSFYRAQAERNALFEEGKLGIRLAFNAFIKSLRQKLK